MRHITTYLQISEIYVDYGVSNLYCLCKITKKSLMNLKGEQKFTLGKFKGFFGLQINKVCSF